MFRKKDQLAELLRTTRDATLNKYSEIDEEDDFQVNLRRHLVGRRHLFVILMKYVNMQLQHCFN